MKKMRLVSKTECWCLVLLLVSSGKRHREHLTRNAAEPKDEKVKEATQSSG